MVRFASVAPSLALVLCACSSPSPTTSNSSKPATTAAAAADMAQMPQPTAEHKMLVEGVGTWEGTMTSYWMPGEPQTGKAKEIVEPIGGFWTQSKFTCDIMGMAYLGTGCVGYDPVKKSYVGTWIDNMSSEFALMNGEMDASGKKLVMHWMGPDMTTGKLVPHRNETVFGKDSYTATFYMGDGAGTKTMVLDMKRTGGVPK